MKKAILFLILIISCNRQSTPVKPASVSQSKVTAEVPKQHSYVPVDFSYKGSGTPIDQEDESTPEAEAIIDDSKKPLDLKEGPYKGRKGLFIEVDIISEKVLSGTDQGNSGKEHYDVISSEGKISCRINPSKNDCTELYTDKIRNRSNPLKPDQLIDSIILPIAGVDDSSIYVHLNGSIHSIGSMEHGRYRFHLLEDGLIESKIFDANTGNFTLSSILINQLDHSSLKEETQIPQEAYKQLPSDATGKEQYFKIRGKYLYVRQDDFQQELLFFNKKDLSDEPEIALKNTFLECIKKHGSRENSDTHKEQCQPALTYHSYTYGDTQGHTTEYFIKYKSFNLESKVLEVNINDKSYFTSLSFCGVDFHTKCLFVNILETAYENDLQRIAKIKREKSNKDLNELIENLRPCLKSKHIECIKKYILKPDEVHKTDEEGCIDDSVDVPSYEFSVNDIPEIERCLNYDSLLFHGNALKGVQKFCFVAPDNVKKENVSARIMAVGNIDLLKTSYFKYSGSNDLPIPLSDFKARTLNNRDWHRGP
jgi:hypothetical protein